MVRHSIEAAERLRPDVIIADLDMPSMSGLDAMERLKKRGLASKFVILTMQTRGKTGSQSHARWRVRVRPEALRRERAD